MKTWSIFVLCIILGFYAWAGKPPIVWNGANSAKLLVDSLFFSDGVTAVGAATPTVVEEFGSNTTGACMSFCIVVATGTGARVTPPFPASGPGDTVFGVTSLESGTDTDSGAMLLVGNTFSFTLKGGESFGARVGFNDLSDGTQGYCATVGFGSSTSLECRSANFIGFTYDSEEDELTKINGNLNWICITSSATDGDHAEVDSNVAVITSDYQYLSFVVNADKTSIVYSINGTEVCTITTFIPDASNERLAYGAASIEKNVGTTERIMYVDVLTADFPAPADR